MSNAVKINLKPIRFNVKLKDNEEPESVGLKTDEELLQIQLEEKYTSGFEDGYEKAKQNLENDFNSGLAKRYAELKKVISVFDEKIIQHDKEFERVIVKLALAVAEKIIRREINEDSSIVESVKYSLRKIIGANSVIVKLNPEDHKKIISESKNLIVDDSFSKIKFETDERVELGGCLVESDIGNVDARISTQFNEIKKQFEAIIFPV